MRNSIFLTGKNLLSSATTWRRTALYKQSKSHFQSFKKTEELLQIAEHEMENILHCIWTWIKKIEIA